MLGAVLTVGGNIGGCDILIEILLDVGADLQHEFMHIRSTFISLLEQLITDHGGIKHHDMRKRFCRPCAVLLDVCADDTVNKIAEHRSGGMIGRNIIFKIEFFQIGEEMDAAAVAFRWEQVLWTKRNAGAGKSVIGVKEIDSVCLKGIENEYVSFFCAVGLIVDNDICTPIIDSNDLDPIVIMVFGKGVFGIENINYRF